MAGLIPAICVFEIVNAQDVETRDKFTPGPAVGRTRLRGYDE